MEQRLIDANALKRAFCNHCDGDEPCTEPCVDIGLIETAPTVIAAESEADADYQLSVLMQEYFERYEPTYNSEDGSM